MSEVGSVHILTIDDCIKYDLIYITSAAFHFIVSVVSISR